MAKSPGPPGNAGALRRDIGRPCDYPCPGHGSPIFRGLCLTPWAVKSGLAVQVFGVGYNHPLALAVWALVPGTRRYPRAVTPIAFDHKSQLRLRAAQAKLKLVAKN